MNLRIQTKQLNKESSQRVRQVGITVSESANAHSRRQTTSLQQPSRQVDEVEDHTPQHYFTMTPPPSPSPPSSSPHHSPAILQTRLHTHGIHPTETAVTANTSIPPPTIDTNPQPPLYPCHPRFPSSSRIYPPLPAPNRCSFIARACRMLVRIGVGAVGSREIADLIADPFHLLSVVQRDG